MPKRKSSKPNENENPNGFEPLKTKYLEWMTVHNYAKTTLKNRDRYLDIFINWAETRALTRPSEVTKQILERFQRYLFEYKQKNGKPLSLSSQQSQLVPVKEYFKWLSRNNYILYNPASEIELPRVEKRLPKYVLSAREAERVINQTYVDDELGLRDRALLEVLYSTGIRRKELINLKVYDLDMERGVVMIRQGKGGKDRLIPIGARAIQWVAKYLIESRPKLVREPDEGYLFITKEGSYFSRNHLTQVVRDYVEAADIGKRGSCHLFRHTMATLLLEAGADIRHIQGMLGHEDISSTQIYTKVSIRKMKEVHTANHPAKMSRDKK